MHGLGRLAVVFACGTVPGVGRCQLLRFAKVAQRIVQLEDFRTTGHLGDGRETEQEPAEQEPAQQGVRKLADIESAISSKQNTYYQQLTDFVMPAALA